MLNSRLLLLLLPLSAVALAARPVSFNEDIRPILADNCFSCHGTDTAHRKGDRRLDTPEGATAAIDGVRALVPGDLSQSELWQRIISRYDDEVMPPPESHKQPLSPEQQNLIRRWIEQGGVYQRHWAFEPMAVPAVPDEPLAAAPKARRAGSHPIDRFLGHKLAGAGLAFAPEASREVLIRRVTLDLTGLPPTLPRSTPFSPTVRPRRLRAGRRPPARLARATANILRATGSTPCGMPTPTACTSTTPATSGPTATGSSAPSTATCPSTASPSNSWPATCCPPQRRSARRHGLQPQSDHHRRSRGDRGGGGGAPRRTGWIPRRRSGSADGQLCVVSRSQIRPAQPARVLFHGRDLQGSGGPGLGRQRPGVRPGRGHRPRRRRAAPDRRARRGDQAARGRRHRPGRRARRRRTFRPSTNASPSPTK
jgi:hypothetical protein